MPLGQLVAVPFDILHVTPKVVLCKVAAAKTLLTRCLLLILPPEHHQHQSDLPTWLPDGYEHKASSYSQPYKSLNQADDVCALSKAAFSYHHIT